MEFSESPRVFIIILNWNGWQDTLECLDSIEELDYPNFEVVIVDNASTDESVREIKDKYPGVVLLESTSNLGYAGGNNIGIRYAVQHHADYVWILNNDTVVDESALTSLVDKMENDPSIGICGSRIIYYHKRDTIQVLAGGSYNKWLGLTTNFGQLQHIDADFDVEQIEENLDFIIGASMLVSRLFIEKIGLISEDYFLYYEEIDWGIRAKGNFKLGFAPSSIVYHKEGASTGATNRNKENKSELSDYYLIKNRLKLTYKFYPYLLPFNYLTSIYSIFNRMRRNQWERIPMMLKLFFTFNK